MYEVFLTQEAQRFYEEADPVLVRKLNRCFRYCGTIPISTQTSSPSRDLWPGTSVIELVIGELSTRFTNRSEKSS